MRITKTFLIQLLFLSQFLYSGDFFSQNSLNEYRRIGVIGDQSVYFKLGNGFVFLKYNDYYTISHVWPKIRDKDSFSFRDIVVRKNGYPYVKVFLWEESILYGSRFFLFLNDKTNVLPGHGGINGIGSDSVSKLSEIPHSEYAYNTETLIQDIECSSFLIEGNHTYDTKMLDKYLGSIDFVNRSEIEQVFNENAHPWVEGVDGPGIGENLTISFTELCCDIVVLNGFVDRNRKYLFKANNRVKTAIIRSDDSGEPFEFDYHFEDMVRFDEIRFPRPAEKVVFEIKDVYPGEKWDDTCISAVLTREPDPYK